MFRNLTCPHCKSPLRVSEQETASVLRCGKCQKPFKIPAVAPPAPAVEQSSSCRLDIGSATDKGMIRDVNEDCFLVQHLTWSDLDICHETALVVVSDGLGGHQAGDRAARLVIRSVGGAMAGVLAGALGGRLCDTTPDALREHMKSAMLNANKTVYAEAQTSADLKGMAATVAVLLVWDGLTLIAHVGDTRVYHHRDGELKQITHDQTLVNRMVELGQLTEEEAKSHPARNEISQAVGLRSQLAPSFYDVQLQEGDSLIICSDGLQTHVSDGRIRDAVRNSGYSASLLAGELVEIAKKAGGTDNITVAAIIGY